MRKLVFMTAALSFVLTSVPAIAQQSTGSGITFKESGTFNGKTYNSVTYNWDNDSITFNYTDGTQFTEFTTDENFWTLLDHEYEERGLGPALD